MILAILLLAGTASAPGTYEMNSGLVAEWHFDGNAQDSSGNGNHGTAGQTTSNPMIRQKWTLVALAYDGNNVVQYINGEKVNFAPLTGELNNSEGKFWIGRNGNEFFHMYFHGTIDEVKIYNRALSGIDPLTY